MWKPLKEENFLSLRKPLNAFKPISFFLKLISKMMERAHAGLDISKIGSNLA